MAARATPQILQFLCLLLLGIGCTPKLIHLASPEFASAPSSADSSISLAYPIDMRMQFEGGYYDSSVPAPLHTYGDLNLRPHPIDAIYDNVHAALRAREITLSDNADLKVNLYVLQHTGTRDTANAQWVSTVTGGIASTASKFFYPCFMSVYGRIRVEILDGEGNTVVIRDINSEGTRRAPVALLWGVLYLWTRAPAAENYEALFLDLHTEMATQVANVIEEVAITGTSTSGTPPTTGVQHSFDPHHDITNTFASLSDDEAAKLADTRYGSQRFSVFSGHSLQRGTTVGRIGLPLDTFGYDIGLTNRLHSQIDLTILGIYNSLSAGLRLHLLMARRTRLSIQGHLGTQFVLLDGRRIRPAIAGWASGANLT
ncbi:MAG: hypothetical protein HN348_32795 [Proteobacteria bacterium]|nr:hypothetical protein [Pseudomonadota bacterium]